MNPVLEDNAYGFLLRSAIPLLVAQPGPRPPAQLRGIVRPTADTARVVLAVPGETAGLGVDYPLAQYRDLPTGTAIIDHARLTVVPQLPTLLKRAAGERDGFGHAIVSAGELGFDPAAVEQPDHNVFSLFSMLVHGGGFPWFEGTFTFAGFMLTAGNDYRVYLRITETGVTYGTDLFLRHANGVPLGVVALPQELAALIHGGDFTGMRATGEGDDYCASLVDMSDWIAALAG